MLYEHTLDQNGTRSSTSRMKPRKVAFDKHQLLSQSPEQKRVSYGVDNKSVVTASTDSLGSQSDTITSVTNNSNRNASGNFSKSLRHFQQLQDMHGGIADYQKNLHKTDSIQHSDRSLHVQNMTMKKDMQEMKTRMNTMEESLQRNSRKEEQLLEAIHALHKVTTKQSEKLVAYKDKTKKLKVKVAERDMQIIALRKERDVLKSACKATEKDFLSMHNEISCLQDELLQSLEQAGRLESENFDLTARLQKLESPARTRKKRPSHDVRSMESTPNSYTSSRKATEELQAKIEQKLFDEMGLHCRSMLEGSQQESRRSLNRS